MRLSALSVVGALAAAVTAQSTFEATDFNVTEALLDVGVNISSIPALEGLVQRSSTSGCSIACSSLQILYGINQVLKQQTSQYNVFTSSYWSTQQASVDPFCVFKPSSSLDVQVLVLLSRLTQCPFAVKSGGHAAFAGASSIVGGITVPFENMKDLTLAKNKKTVFVEPGNLWHDVYSQLESQNLAVIGGRVAAIGVGGLTTGGGISFFSNQYGWACDNVASYEVVTASGIIVTASPQSYPDLYWALRGGGNNFGIVTKFELVTFPQGMMWGGPRVIAESAFPAAIKAFYNLAKNAAQDTNAAQILSFVYTQGQRIASAELEYAKPIANAPIFKEWMAVPSIQDNTGIRSLSELTINLNDSNPNGLRETYWAASFKLDLSFASFIKDVFFEEVSSFSDAAALTAAGTIQGITLPQLQHMAQNGGNPLGLSAADGPFILFNPAIMWSNPADDARILKATSNMIKRTVAEAKKRGLFNDYIYMNYASQFQAVIPSYGVDSQRKLKSIAEKYDPTGVFQDLQPGYFKLDGAPNSNMP